MISVVTLFTTLICYFHYNQLPIYNLNLAYKFIKNSTHKENFELLSSNLGYNLNDKLLLIHADDLGLSKSVNEVAIKHSPLDSIYKFQFHKQNNRFQSQKGNNESKTEEPFEESFKSISCSNFLVGCGLKDVDISTIHIQDSN